MGGLLPTSSDATVERSGEPTVLCIADDRTEEVLAALGSETARSVFRRLNREPTTPATLAEDLNMSVQNAGYHLENLREAGLVDVHDTVYSEKGREVKVFGPVSEPLVVFLGSSEDEAGLRSAFERFSSAVGPVALLIVLKRSLKGLLDVGDWA